MHDQPPSGGTCPGCRTLIPLEAGRIQRHRRVTWDDRPWWMEPEHYAYVELCPGSGLWPTLP